MTSIDGLKKGGGDMSEELSATKERIVQLLMSPQDATWQNRLLGLGSDGVTYELSPDGFWEPFIPPLGVMTLNNKLTGQ